MLALILYFVGSHIISFLCSIFEAVLLSCTDSYVTLLKKRGARISGVLEKLKAEIDRPLAAILTLNTISHTFGAAGVGASVVEVFGDKWLALGSVILTLTMLYWTEMLPKTIGALYWKGLLPFCAKPIQWLIYITYPFVITFNFFARFLTRNQREQKITEEDLKAAFEVGALAGVIQSDEQDMLENILRLGERKVGVLMRPRVDIVWLDQEDSPEALREQILTSKHHRFPLCKGVIDEVIGVVNVRDLLEKAWRSEPIDLKTLARPPLFVQEQQKVFELMDLLRKHHQEIALVTDEYGTIQGMLTLGDIMHAIIKDVEFEEGASIVPLSKTSWLLDGSLPVDEFKEYFHFDHLPEEEWARYRTLSGLCMTELGRIPKRGDTFQVEGYEFEVITVQRRRVEKVLLRRL